SEARRQAACAHRCHRGTGKRGRVVGQLREALDAAYAAIGRFAWMTPEQHDAVTLYAGYTHTARGHDTAPRLVIRSQLPGSGKSALGDKVLRHLCWQGTGGGRGTAAYIYQSLGRYEEDACIGTMVLDEMDTLSKEAQDALTAVLNLGYERGKPYGV